MTTRTSPSLPSAPAELDRWRRETPGCRDRIHLNNAGASLMPQAVLQAVTAHLEREAAIGGYEAEDEAEPKVRETYELLGRVVGAAARNMAIVENATVAFSQAMSALDRKSTRLNSSHLVISYAVFCLKKKKQSRNIYGS